MIVILCDVRSTSNVGYAGTWRTEEASHYDLQATGAAKPDSPDSPDSPAATRRPRSSSDHLTLFVQEALSTRLIFVRGRHCATWPSAPQIIPENEDKFQES